MLSTLACDGVYEFVSRVSGVRTALAGAEFSFDGAFAMHGAMWKIALREPDAESHLAKCLDRFASTLDDEASVLALKRRVTADPSERARGKGEWPTTFQT